MPSTGDGVGAGRVEKKVAPAEREVGRAVSARGDRVAASGRAAGTGSRFLGVLGATSLRGAGRAWGVIQHAAGLSQKVRPGRARDYGCSGGHDKLTRAKEQGEDGGWIVDHVVEVGREKGLMIVGVARAPTPRGRVSHACGYRAHRDLPGYTVQGRACVPAVRGRA